MQPGVWKFPPQWKLPSFPHCAGSATNLKLRSHPKNGSCVNVQFQLQVPWSAWVWRLSIKNTFTFVARAMKNFEVLGCVFFSFQCYSLLISFQFPIMFIFFFYLKSRNVSKLCSLNTARNFRSTWNSMDVIDSVSHCEIVTEMRSPVNGLFYCNEGGKV